MLRFSLSILFTILFFATSAQPLLLSNKGNVEVKGQVTFWKDETGNLTLEEVKLLQLKPLASAEAPNFGFSRAAYWFKFEIANHSDDPNWLLEVSYAPLDHVDFYLTDGINTLHKISGDTYSMTSRDLIHRNINFQFRSEPQSRQTIYLRVQTISSVQVPLTLWRESVFHQTNNTIQLVNGLFYGGMLLMLFYQLFQLFFQPSKITFFYIFTILTMVNVVSFFQGYNFLYLYPNTPELNDTFAIFTGPAFVICSTLFTRSFLNLRSFSKTLDTILLSNMALDFIAGILMYLLFPVISYKYHHYFMLLHCLLTLVSAGYCYFLKYKPARYYLISWLTVLVAAVFFTISNLGFVPGFLSTKYLGLMIGCSLQVLFISYALADRMFILQKENQHAKELELKRNQLENERLEREVQERTEEISQKNERLKEVIRVKDKLFSVVSHDIKGPLGSLRMALRLLQSGDVSPEEFRHLAKSLENRFAHTTEFIENLLQWANLQIQAPSYNPKPIVLQDMLQETIQLMDEEIKNKAITTTSHLHHELTAYADVDMMRSVFRNLVTNAIKFSNHGGSIEVRAKHQQDNIIVSITDNGVGIPLENQNKLFTLNSITTPGTKQEKGTGLGLILCKEFLEKNKGSIWLESDNGKGTTFYFSLPAKLE